MTALALLWPRVWAFLKSLPWWLWAGLVAVVVGYYEVERGKKDQREKDEAKVKADQAKVAVEVSQTQVQLEQHRSADAQRGNEMAARVSSDDHPSKLRQHSKAVADELLGPDPGGI
jgi:hypothetical protein